MSFFAKSAGILGINSRNLQYLSRYNSKTKKKLADDKIGTKHFLQARGLGVAKLYASLKSLPELRNFNPKALPKSFVIKPNRGYGGEGIIAIQKTQGSTYTDVNDKKYKWDDLVQHCISILDGKFAISGLRDKVLFEELLISNEYFNKYIEAGLPDIRIIVFKYVPVIAMLRLPTMESHGKANLHLGAVGIGIDIGTGKTTYGVQYNKIIKKLPNGLMVNSIVIPHWDEILLAASRTQYMTQVGYLAVDIALAKSGIKILEINARAGLAIQISNHVMLRNRLNKISDLKVLSPIEGVKLGKTLFTKIIKKENTKVVSTSKPVIGLYEYVNIITTNSGPIKAKIDPHSSKNIINSKISIPEEKKLLTLLVRNKKIKIPFIREDLSDHSYKIIISGKYLSDFLVDVSKTVPEYRAAASSETREEKIILNIDKKICSINEQIGILSRIKPINIEDEQKTFLKNPAHSPKFIYKKHDLDINYYLNELKKIPRLINHPLMPLYLKKIEEIKNKLLLVKHVGEPELIEYSHKVFGEVNEHQYEQAIKFIKESEFSPDTSKRLKIDDIVKKTEKFLIDKKLSRWKIKVLETSTSGMQINKKNTIFISKKSKITAFRFQALLAHEIETHIYRLENGRLQKYKLFEQGTANYLTTEEGLAIYNQNKLGLPLGNKYLRPALNVIAIHHANSMSFVELFHYLIKNMNIPEEKAWWVCLRVKRGLQNTNQHGALTKDLAYFNGQRMILQLIKDKGENEIKKLYVGKIGIMDLKYLGNEKQWPIKFLPPYLAETK
ncbi:MAG: tyrosine/phenylalanine carboxypeptidase domain-containing protein [Candidatus Kerfeldbacteria bacterium]